MCKLIQAQKFYVRFPDAACLTDGRLVYLDGVAPIRFDLVLIEIDRECQVSYTLILVLYDRARAPMLHAKKNVMYQLDCSVCALDDFYGIVR